MQKPPAGIGDHAHKDEKNKGIGGRRRRRRRRYRQPPAFPPGGRFDDQAGREKHGWEVRAGKGEREGHRKNRGGARNARGPGRQVGGRAAGGLAKQKGFADELICDERAYGRA